MSRIIIGNIAFNEEEKHATVQGDYSVIHNPKGTDAEAYGELYAASKGMDYLVLDSPDWKSIYYQPPVS